MKFLILVLTILWLPLSALSQVNPAAGATNQFAFDLYKKNSKKPGNLFFSPLSIEVALAMTAAGAQKETLSQMIKTLHLPANYHSEFRALLGQLKGNRDFQLFLANRIWGSQGTEYNPSFLNLLHENYAADLLPLDFQKQPEPSRIIINEWVQQQTNDKIKDLLPKGSIDADTELVLTNAIYFKAKWAEPFKKDLTKEDSFFMTAAQKKSIPFMHLTSHFRYGENADMQFLEMNYQGSDLAMDILLPKNGTELSSIEKKISASVLEELHGKSSNEMVQVSIPKFKMESSMSLKETLMAMGMSLAFDEAKANFHGMRKILLGKNLSISRVEHKAFVDIDEEGTEAAAATAVVMFGKASFNLSGPLKIFNANRPFLFLIRHLNSGAILFIGRYTQP